MTHVFTELPLLVQAGGWSGKHRLVHVGGWTHFPQTRGLLVVNGGFWKTQMLFAPSLFLQSASPEQLGSGQETVQSLGQDWFVSSGKSQNEPKGHFWHNPSPQTGGWSRARAKTLPEIKASETKTIIANKYFFISVCLQSVRRAAGKHFQKLLWQAKLFLVAGLLLQALA